MDALNHILKATPEIALFAALALGHALGRIKLGSFSLGGVAGSLIVALVIGPLTGVVMPDALKAVCFALFIYSVGFKSGPEFFGGLNRASLKLVLSAVVPCVAALITVIVIARGCGFGKGFSAGIGAGALTQTAMLGTAGDAASRLGLGAEELTKVNSKAFTCRASNARGWLCRSCQERKCAGATWPNWLADPIRWSPWRH